MITKQGDGYEFAYYDNRFAMHILINVRHKNSIKKKKLDMDTKTNVKEVYKSISPKQENKCPLSTCTKVQLDLKSKGKC